MNNFVLLILLIVLITPRVAVGQRSLVVHFVPNDMDEAFFNQTPPGVVAIDVKETLATRLVLTTDNRLRSLTILNAQNLHEYSLHDNGMLSALLLRSCTVGRLLGAFRKLHGLTILKIEHCQLNGTLNLAELQTLPFLTVFSVENNQLTHIDLWTLTDEEVPSSPPSSVSVLEHIDLSGNLLEHFSLHVLSPFHHLKELMLNRNRLKSVTGEVMLAELSVLAVKTNLFDELDLSGCNCSALVSVYGAENNLTAFPKFHHSSLRIRSMELAYNALTVVRPGDLAQHHHLTYLMLSNNAIEKFETDGTVVELPHLSILLLVNNRLESLDMDGWHMPALAVIRIDRNPVRAIPMDLMTRYPKLKKLSCYCSVVPCAWVTRHAEQIRMRYIELNLVYRGDTGNDTDIDLSQCEPILPVGCVACVKGNDTDSNQA